MFVAQEGTAATVNVAAVFVVLMALLPLVSLRGVVECCQSITLQKVGIGWIAGTTWIVQGNKLRGLVLWRVVDIHSITRYLCKSSKGWISLVFVN